VGVIGIGRVKRRHCQVEQPVVIIDRDGKTARARSCRSRAILGLERVDVTEARAGDIVCVTGIDKLNISDTLCDPDHVRPAPADSRRADDQHDLPGQRLAVRRPGGQVRHQPPDPARPPRARTDPQRRPARRRPSEPDKYKVSGRGELHLSVLIENMRREGFELAVSRPEVILQEVDGVMQEPHEALVIDCDEQHQGSVMEAAGSAQGRSART
jgi:GTP-binding protein